MFSTVSTLQSTVYSQCAKQCALQCECGERRACLRRRAQATSRTRFEFCQCPSSLIRSARLASFTGSSRSFRLTVLFLSSFLVLLSLWARLLLFCIFAYLFIESLQTIDVILAFSYQYIRELEDIYFLFFILYRWLFLQIQSTCKSINKDLSS